MIDFSQDYFALFGLPPRYRFDPERLEAAYHALQRAVHPDRYAAAGETEEMAQAEAAADRPRLVALLQEARSDAAALEASLADRLDAQAWDAASDAVRELRFLLKVADDLEVAIAEIED